MNFDNLIFAHRGVHDNIKIPENSILSFKKAIKYKFNIELDIQLTKDNVLVVFHDDNLKRLTGINNSISNLTYNKLNDLRLLNTDQKIPRLKDILNIVNGKVILDIEIKNTKKIKKLCTELIKELDNYKYPFIIKSFNPKIIRWLKKHKPEYIRGLLIKDNYYNKFLGRIIIKYCKPNFLALSKKFINNNGINKYLKKYPILIWTIINKDELKKYNHITKNYICNNIPF